MAALIHFDCSAEECHRRRRCRAAPVDSPRGALLIGRGMGRNLSALLFFSVPDCFKCLYHDTKTLLFFFLPLTT